MFYRFKSRIERTFKIQDFFLNLLSTVTWRSPILQPEEQFHISSKKLWEKGEKNNYVLGSVLSKSYEL